MCGLSHSRYDLVADVARHARGLADALRFVSLPSADAPDPLASARALQSHRGEGNNTYRQHEQLTARSRTPLKGIEQYEQESGTGTEEISTPRGTKIRSGSVTARAKMFQDMAERSPSPAWLKDRDARSSSRDPSPARTFTVRRAEANEFGASFR